MSMKWYFVRCQSGREDSIARNALTRLRGKGVSDVIPQVLVPFERVTDLKSGKKRIKNKKLYPGYLMVQADIDDLEDARVLAARDTLRQIDGLRDFLGTRGEATPLSDAEVGTILARMSDTESKPAVTITRSKLGGPSPHPGTSSAISRQAADQVKLRPSLASELGQMSWASHTIAASSTASFAGLPYSPCQCSRTTPIASTMPSST